MQFIYMRTEKRKYLMQVIFFSERSFKNSSIFNLDDRAFKTDVKIFRRNKIEF